ncbi:type VII secretion target, partial [Williamsia sp.]|uniref:type VII secretion target n=1 Tax=Williamsia sp. TaxID=1872085 RepID=UPI001A27ACF2
IDKGRVHTIAKKWEECHSALTDTAKSAGDAGGDWAPAVRAAVQEFADAWRADLTQLAAEADTTQRLLGLSAQSYAITDEEAAERMKEVQRSVGAPS